MVKRSRQRFTKRFNFALTEAMQNSLYIIADKEHADDDVAEVIRRMIAREIPFFLAYTSEYKKLPGIEV